MVERNKYYTVIFTLILDKCTRISILILVKTLIQAGIIIDKSLDFFHS